MKEPVAYLNSSLLASLPWIAHGFGTRDPSAVPDPISWVKQIHSNLVLLANQPGVLGEGDALITNQPGIAISIRTADCYPILLADTRSRAVAAIHAGWRGTASRIVLKSLEKMNAAFSTEPGDVVAAIGPGIGACCYEVGDEVSRQFGREGKIHLDLALENRKQLEKTGVLPENIEALGGCTFCSPERFFSYRREKEKAGRMTSFVRIEAGIKPR